MTFLSTIKAAALSAAMIVSVALPAAHADEQYFPLQSYRVGPYAAGGTGFFGGFIDYLNLINIRDGGVNGVKLTWTNARPSMRSSAVSNATSGRRAMLVPPPGIRSRSASPMP